MAGRHTAHQHADRHLGSPALPTIRPGIILRILTKNDVITTNFHIQLRSFVQNYGELTAHIEVRFETMHIAYLELSFEWIFHSGRTVQRGNRLDPRLDPVRPLSRFRQGCISYIL